MDTGAIIAALKRLGVTHEKIGAAIGRDRSAATKMLSGARAIKVSEMTALQALIADAERDAGETGDIAQPSRDYVAVKVLPSYAGMGGGGSGEGDQELAMISRRLIEEELRGTASDFELIDCRGDSMGPDFLHGDSILVDKRDRDPRQPGPFALWDGDGYVIKLVERIPQKRGWYRIFSANGRYSESEVEETETTIMGRPVWFARRL